MRNAICIELILAFAAVIGCGDDNGGTAPTNHRPVMAVQGDTTSAVGDSLELWASAEDIDGDPLTYSLTVYLTFAELKLGYFPDTQFDADTGHFIFKPSSEDQPSREFTFAASDGRGGADSTTFTVTVN